MASEQLRIIVRPTEASQPVSKDGVCRTSILFLPHPRTGTLAQFLHDMDAKRLHEILELSPQPGKEPSYMTDTQIIESAPFYLASPFDPAYLLVGHFERALKGSGNTSNTFEETFDLLDGLPPRIHDLLEAHVGCVCEKLEGTDGYWRYSREKAHGFFKARVEAVASRLPQKILQQLPDETEHREKASLRAAYELVSSYLPANMAAGLRGEYDFEELARFEAAQGQTHYVNPNEFVKKGGGADAAWDESGTAGKEKPALKKQRSVGVDKLAKASTKGMKPMTSFFKPKGK
ncbi:hypothetical protein PYCC9005_002325 [Savitreella phatthalungensis]